MDESNVKPIESAYKKPVPKDGEWTQVQIQNDIINHIADLHRRKLLAKTYPDLWPRYRTMRLRDEDLETIFFVNDRKEVKVVSQRSFDLIMTGFYRKLFSIRYDNEPMSVSAQHQTTSVLMQFIEEIDPKDVKIFAWPNEDVICWKKLDFRLIAPSKFIEVRDRSLLDNDEDVALLPPTDIRRIMSDLEMFAPNWHSIVKRCGNQKAFLSWIGSIFHRDSRNPQFVYMYGDGGDSKGTILQTFQRILGEELYHTENLPEPRSGALRFFSANLEGKLLLMCPDNGKMDVFSPFMKSLTGGDPLAVEKKGKQTRNATNNVRVLILSNDRPVIPNKSFAKRRIILVPVTPFEGTQIADFESVLYDERMEFLSICSMVYGMEAQPMQIEQDESVYRQNAQELDSDIVEAIKEYLHVEDNWTEYKQAYVNVPKKLWPHMRVAKFNDYVKEKMPQYSTKKVKEVLVQHFGLSETDLKYSIADGLHGSAKCVMGVRPAYTTLAGKGIRIDKEGREVVEQARIVTKNPNQK